MEQGFTIEGHKWLDDHPNVWGFVDVRMPSGLIIQDISVLKTREGPPRIKPPDKVQIGRDREPVRRDGRLAYVPVIRFADETARARWEARVLEALRAVRPDLFR